MTKLLCLDDSYLQECTANVTATDPTTNRVQLDQTVFYPTGGGVPCDFGTLSTADGRTWKVTDVNKNDGAVWHVLDSVSVAASGLFLAVGDVVSAKIDWERRYKLIRMHTATHILATAMHGKGFGITGNQIGIEQTRVDFNCETGAEKEALEAGVAEANAKLMQSVELKVYSLPREQALQMPGMVKLANVLPPAVTELRIVEIPGIDTQADGGCHVKNVNEIGQIKLEKVENKGSKNKRVYFSLFK
ncbi:alanyl-tRNA editing protein [Candidatus Micrarchaeota archaeon]|nr:alanyl-tRNA editing protein [Candidatus Micrarchaeota archaeon]